MAMSPPKVPYTKPHLSLPEQIAKLRSRGLAVNDETKARHYLSIVGYYRLSSYCYRLEEPPTANCRSHKFRDGTSFDDVIRLYVFDQRLRSLMLEALERFEIAARTVWAHELSAAYGPHAFLNPQHFEVRETYAKNLVALFSETRNAVKTSEEVAHYHEHYNDPELPPVWTLVSLMSFGELFHWIRNTASTPVKLKVAQAFGFSNIQLFESVARSLNVVRNICAHHGRLWDQRLTMRMPLIEKYLIVPMVAVQKPAQVEADNRMYNCIAVLAHILLTLTADSSWPQRVGRLVADHLTPREQQLFMGFPKDWQNTPFWHSYVTEGDNMR